MSVFGPKTYDIKIIDLSEKRNLIRDEKQYLIAYEAFEIMQTELNMTVTEETKHSFV